MGSSSFPVLGSKTFLRKWVWEQCHNPQPWHHSIGLELFGETYISSCWELNDWKWTYHDVQCNNTWDEIYYWPISIGRGCCRSQTKTATVGSTTSTIPSNSKNRVGNYSPSRSPVNQTSFRSHKKAPGNFPVESQQIPLTSPTKTMNMCIKHLHKTTIKPLQSHHKTTIKPSKTTRKSPVFWEFPNFSRLLWLFPGSEPPSRTWWRRRSWATATAAIPRARPSCWRSASTASTTAARGIAGGFLKQKKSVLFSINRLISSWFPIDFQSISGW